MVCLGTNTSIGRCVKAMTWMSLTLCTNRLLNCIIQGEGIRDHLEVNMNIHIQFVIKKMRKVDDNKDHGVRRGGC